MATAATAVAFVESERMDEDFFEQEFDHVPPSQDAHDDSGFTPRDRETLLYVKFQGARTARDVTEMKKELKEAIQQGDVSNKREIDELRAKYESLDKRVTTWVAYVIGGCAVVTFVSSWLFKLIFH